MSALLLVRHGKASPMSADYDKLSPLGLEQAKLIGEHWAERGVTLDAVFVGPRKRHAETHAAAHDAFRAKGGGPWPGAIVLPELDEHDGIGLVFKALPTVAARDPGVRAVADAMARGETPPLQGVLQVFKQITREWVRGEVGHEDVEPWGAFRARVARALEQMAAGVGRGKTAVAFTSAGAVASAVGDVLGIGDEKVLDLSWSLVNASITQLAFSEGRWGMRTFNETPHLVEPRLLTAV